MTGGVKTATDRDLLEQLVEQGSIKAAAAALQMSTQGAKNRLLQMRRERGARSTYELIYLLATGDLD